MSVDQIKDMVKGTLKELGRLKFNQIAQDLQSYEIMGRIMKREKKQFDDGIAIQRNLMVRIIEGARHTGLFAVDEVNAGDVLEQITIPWTHTTTNYPFERREIAMQRSAAKIVDIVKTRRVGAFLGLAKIMERDGWSAPADVSDVLAPWGIPFWIQKNASEGFNGGNPAGFPAGPGGLSHANFRNYTGAYTQVSKADLIKLMRRAYRKIHFESPVSIPDYRSGRGDRYRIYVNLETMEALEDVGEAQNENLGRDLAPYDGSIAFRRNPIVWVPYLDADTTNPVYFINYAYFHPVFLRGEYLREQGPEKAPSQHTTLVVYIDLTWNMLCTDRRAQAVLHKPS
ncbi:phage major capsid protein [bacterium]|nr:phage major capsid protein [bacterium]